MIPTRLKAKLPKTHAYPIGAEAVCRALESAAQPPSAIVFDHATMWDRERHRLVLDLVCGRRPPVHGSALGDASRYEPTCELTVLSVLRRDTATVAVLLEEVALPEAAAWLKSHPDRAASEPLHHLRYYVDGETSQLIRHEREMTI